LLLLLFHRSMRYIFFVVWLYVSFIIIMYGMYLLLHRWESHFLSPLPIVVAGCQYYICYIAKLKSGKYFHWRDYYYFYWFINRKNFCSLHELIVA
jgi:hypothetical protein